MPKIYNKHPHARPADQLTFGERAADIMRNGFGSWMFVMCFAMFLGIWMLINTAILHKGFDPYPYILLNLCLSMLAALQGAFILIAAKRADRVAAEEAHAHYLETSKIDELLTENTELTRTVKTNTDMLEEIHRHVTAITPDAGIVAPDGSTE
jgi:uncharacterized membrane protein